MQYGDRVSILRHTDTTDAYGDDVDGPLVEIPHLELVCVQPQTSDEDTPGRRARSTVTTGWILRTRPGSDIDLRSDDRVRWQGRVLEVVGEVSRWPHPLRPGAVHHAEASLQLVE